MMRLYGLAREQHFMEEMDTNNNEMIDTLVDWFETIEEVSLSQADRMLLQEAADSLEALRGAGLENGIQPEDFDEWLRFNILEQWSCIMETMEDEPTGIISGFHGYIREGEQRLYLQMLKQCMPVAVCQQA
jgi:hypothetical protein